ncbi:MAG: ANTAR domain-containing protein [Treponema sp.]|nr:ANTAR domain-containing protein [Treponema sp.]
MTAEKPRKELSVQEKQLIARAKLVLMHYLKMSEDQAHKFIEKQSMNLRQSKVTTAISILNTYELKNFVLDE